MAVTAWTYPIAQTITGSTKISEADNKIQAGIDDLVAWTNGTGAYASSGFVYEANTMLTTEQTNFTNQLTTQQSTFTTNLTTWQGQVDTAIADFSLTYYNKTESDGRFLGINANAVSATTAASCTGNSATATTASSCSGNSATASTCTGNSATATWADQVDVNSGNTSANWYDLVWHSGDQVYSTTTIECYPASGIIQASQMRAAIFYDSNNTGYYADFSTTGTSINCAGSIVAGGNVTAYSDRKLKTNIELIPNALDKVSKINGYTFNMKDQENKQTGVIAQEVQDVLPEAVISNVDDSGEETLSVAYGNMVGLLIESIKELKAEIEELKAK